MGKRKTKKFVPYDEKMKLKPSPDNNLIGKINNSLNTSSEISESSKSNVANDSFDSTASLLESSKSENYDDDIQGQSLYVEKDEKNTGSSTQGLDSKNQSFSDKVEFTDAYRSSDVAILENELKEVSLQPVDDKRNTRVHSRNYAYENNRIYPTESRGYAKSNRREDNTTANTYHGRIHANKGRGTESYRSNSSHKKSELSSGECHAGFFNENKDTGTLNAYAEAFVPCSSTDNINKQTSAKNWDDDSCDGNSDKDKPSESFKNKSTFTNSQVRRSGGVNKKGEFNRSPDCNWRNNTSNIENKGFSEQTEKYNSNRHSLGNSDTKDHKSHFKSRFSDPRIIRERNFDLDKRSEKVDAEYNAFLKEEKKNEEVEYTRISEIEQDLFTVAKDYSLGHCVAEDLKMGSGIAVHFRREFKDLGDLYSQKQKQGGLAILEQEHEGVKRYIYYLITKRESTGKPTYETFWSSLKKMRDHISDYSVKKLAIPRIGCGLDRLEWSRVKHMIDFLFKDVEVEIVVCNFNQTEEAPQKVSYRNKVVHVQKPVAEIESETTIIYLSTEDGHISKEMEQLSTKFSSFLREFKQAQTKLGDLVRYEDKANYYILYGCIVRKTSTEDFDFKMFQKCIQQINKNNKKDEYQYIAIQAIKDDNDGLINEKIITILRNYFINVDIYICWDGDLVSQMPLPRNE